MRAALIAALLVSSACATGVESGRPGPWTTATPQTGPVVRTITSPGVQPVEYKITPLEIRLGGSATTKTAIAFANPNRFLVDWSMTVRLRDRDGAALRDERIGSIGAPIDRSDARFQNWYFPIPPGDSWTVVRFETAFNQSDVQEVRLAPSAETEVESVAVSAHRCFDSGGAGVACELGIVSTEPVPPQTRLHLVVVVESAAAPKETLRALQWRPELAAAEDPWLVLSSSKAFRITFQDNYPSPQVPWDYRVVVHAYRFAR